MKKINIIPDGEVEICRIELPAEFTSIATDEYRRQIGLCMAKGVRYYIFDFGKVEFIDSAGLGTIISTAKHVRDMDGDIRLAAMQPTALKTFKLIHADRFILTCDSVDAAIRSFPINRKTPLRFTPNARLANAY